MKLNDAKIKLSEIVNKPLGTWMSQSDLSGIKINKGKSGQLLEIALGLQNTSNKLDFVDGELKTNKCDRYGNPKETMFITQISEIIDDLLQAKPFNQSRIYTKINNLLYVPISKDGNPEQWFFLPYTHINLDSPEHSRLKVELENDYYSICRQLNDHIRTSSDGYIHTSNGTYIQIRSKDSTPYHPIYSNIYNKYVSNKNHAFYFKKEFMKHISNY